MKCWEAISLGHTLIREDSSVFYSHEGDRGCATGSAIAATGEGQAYWAGAEANMGYSGIDWLQESWPWTAEIAPLGLAAALVQPTGESIALSISCAHVRGMPRMDIAKILSRYEPEWSQFVGGESPVPEAVRVARPGGRAEGGGR